MTILIILDIWQVSLNSGWFCITILILNRFLPYLVGSPEPASLLSVEHVSAKSTIDRLSGIHNMVFHIWISFHLFSDIEVPTQN